MNGLSYARASQDRTGEELSVVRQNEDHRTLAKLRKVTIVRELTDNDVSAAGKRKRPGFEAALDMVRQGKAQVIIATDMSRLTRGKARDEVRLLELGLETGLQLWFVRAPDLDLSTAAGRLTASILISTARHEIEQKSERQRRASLQAVEKGRPVGGRRVFGYEADKMTKREEEAAAIHDAYMSLLAGVPLGSIATTINSGGLFTTQRRRTDGQPSPWTGQTVRDMLTNPRYAGLRAVTIRPESGRPRWDIRGPAAWPAIVPEETWRAAQAILTDPSRRKPGRIAVALLTGIAACGIAGCDMRVHRGGDNAGVSTYRCRSGKHIVRRSDPIDAFITDVVVARLSRADAKDLLTTKAVGVDVAALREEALAAQARMEEAADLFAMETITAKQLTRITEHVRTRLAEIDALITDAGRVDILGELINAKDVRKVWNGLGVGRQRAVVAALMTITLLSPGRGARGFRPETVEINWIK